MKPDKISQERIDLCNKIIAHIETKGKGYSYHTPAYRSRLARISGVSESLISMMMDRKHIPSTDSLRRIQLKLEETDSIFEEVKVNMKWGKRRKVEGSKFS